ncbi:hypothetical protein [Bartonella rattaustraliani]|nr:hypothetical protein [Bartonella rattaustraliani]
MASSVNGIAIKPLRATIFTLMKVQTRTLILDQLMVYLRAHSIATVLA